MNEEQVQQLIASYRNMQQMLRAGGDYIHRAQVNNPSASVSAQQKLEANR